MEINLLNLWKLIYYINGNIIREAAIFFKDNAIKLPLPSSLMTVEKKNISVIFFLMARPVPFPLGFPY